MNGMTGQTIHFRVLGCAGGTGDGRHTTSFLVDDDLLIDAGTGITRLTLDEMRRIDSVFLTHAHLDHVLGLPLLVDAVAGERAQPLRVFALPEVIDILRAHIFNWRIWPDFAVLPDAAQPLLTYTPVSFGESINVGGRELTALPVAHGEPAAGYRLRGGGGSLIFSGDTTSHAEFWRIVNATADLRHLIVEASFPNRLRDLADASRHYCPANLLPDLAGLRGDAAVWITHLKPGQEDEIMAELRAAPRAAALMQEQRIVW
jgi:cAMP phosphodiesterase